MRHSLAVVVLLFAFAAIAQTPNACPPMTNANMFIAYVGGISGCTATSGRCQANEPLTFTVVSVGYNFGCATHAFTWNFGDGLTASTATTSASHVFPTGGTYNVSVTINNGAQVFTTSTSVVVASPGVPVPPCSPVEACVSQHYAVTLVANDSNGSIAPGLPIAQNGPFAYFSLPTLTNNLLNPEVFVKVLETGVGKPWVFYAGLTNLDYTIAVRDKTGTFNKSYRVPAPPPGSSQSFGNFDVDGATSSTCLPVSVDRVTVAPASKCATDTSSLCLLDRFSVTLDARDNPSRTNRRAPGQTMPVIGNQFGFFSVPGISFDPSNAEAFVKMVDGRSLNNHFWLFLGGLTDMQLTFTVTDTWSGAQNIYVKPAASTCGWNDTSAFVDAPQPPAPATCPTMTNANLFVNYLGMSSGCSPTKGGCSAGEQLQFVVAGTYPFSCANHIISWDFGDGTPILFGTSVQHAFAGGGTFPVRVTITNGQQVFTLLQTIAIGPLPNFVVNGTFDHDLSGWSEASSVGPGSAQWTPQDALGKSGSGSAQVTSAPGSTSSHELGQCIAATPNHVYEVGADLRVNQTDPTAIALFAVFGLTGTHCDGDVGPHVFMLPVSTPNQWQSRQDVLVTDGTVHSLYVAFAVSPTSASAAAASISADNVFVRQRQ